MIILKVYGIISRSYCFNFTNVAEDKPTILSEILFIVLKNALSFLNYMKSHLDQMSQLSLINLSKVLIEIVFFSSVSTVITF